MSFCGEICSYLFHLKVVSVGKEDVREAPPTVVQRSRYAEQRWICGRPGWQAADPCV